MYDVGDVHPPKCVLTAGNNISVGVVVVEWWLGGSDSRLGITHLLCEVHPCGHRYFP